MKSFIRLTDFKKEELLEIFKIADSIEEYADFLKGKTVVMFFPASSIRTRVSFEKGIYLLGGQSIRFDSATLDKKEDIKDVCGYLENWADAVIVRHKDIRMLERMANSNAVLNPCPPFYRGEEVSQGVIDSVYFVGYEFKKSLLKVQQAILIYCMSH